MNYINKLQTENIRLKLEILSIQTKVVDTISYYHLAKFKGFENDYAHVSTDVLIRLTEILDTIETN